LDLSASFQGKLELAADKKIESLKQKRKRPTLPKTALTTDQSMSNLFFLGLKGDSISKEEGVMLTQVRAFIEKHETDKATPQLLDLKFCLPCDLKDEVSGGMIFPCVSFFKADILFEKKISTIVRFTPNFLPFASYTP
jgi:hypothetical protein